jgi:hypothetical protein
MLAVRLRICMQKLRLMEKFWNLIYYFAYKADYRFHLFFNRINPLLWIYKLNFAKKRFAKMNIDNPVNELNKSFQRTDFGISSFRAGGFMILLITLICFGFVFIYTGIYHFRGKLGLFTLIVMSAITLSLNYYLLFRHSKYIHYFKKFDKLERTEKIKKAYLCLGVVIVIIIFCVGSFIFMIHRFH